LVRDLIQQEVGWLDLEPHNAQYKSTSPKKRQKKGIKQTGRWKVGEFSVVHSANKQRTKNTVQVPRKQ